MTEQEAFDAMIAAADRKEWDVYYAMKDKVFAFRKERNGFGCEKCKEKLYCCDKDYHHLYDCCLHCGNDERYITKRM